MIDVSHSPAASLATAPLIVAKRQQQLVADMALKLVESAVTNASQVQSLPSAEAPSAITGSTSLGGIIDVRA